MFEQDYIIRMIKEMVRVILKLLFNIDADSQTAKLFENEQKQNLFNKLKNRIDEGDINNSENELYSIIENREKEDLEIAILFYSYLNDMDEDFLLEHDFSREEVKSGLQAILSKYGFKGITDIFL
ncbi:DUF6483 family protein [[Clostridium] fimetarium]|uniref:Uncharacterized protein n=1 Tax=[Clostridium] fimetarium TaxID=99656 RepID=A0A1I0Q6M9_9FIRM|nr:DUF6483 family protein [[Clostridium] fimetarium]SEW22643.1 hypothetical protein SAMN05421659_10742 [[Clostridium] fimetarium]